MLGRNLCDRPPVVHLFSQAGRGWLGELELPFGERLTLEGCVRQIDFHDGEIQVVERTLAEQALASPQIRRLMTVPRVNMITAATFVASVGDIGRSPRHASS